jgi:hypothetical protein
MLILTQAIASFLFIILWFIYGFFMGNKKRRYFIKFATLYWMIGALLCILGYFANLANLAIIFIPAALVFAGPLYGTRYLLGVPSDILFINLSIAITYLSWADMVKNKIMLLN